MHPAPTKHAHTQITKIEKSVLKEVIFQIQSPTKCNVKILPNNLKKIFFLFILYMKLIPKSTQPVLVLDIIIAKTL